LELTEAEADGDEPATWAAFVQERFSNVVAAPGGSVYFATHHGDHRVRRIVPLFRGYDSTGIVIGSEAATSS
jgi:hypothetical protein